MEAYGGGGPGKDPALEILTLIYDLRSEAFVSAERAGRKSHENEYILVSSQGGGQWREVHESLAQVRLGEQAGELTERYRGLEGLRLARTELLSNWMAGIQTVVFEVRRLDSRGKGTKEEPVFVLREMSVRMSILQDWQGGLERVKRWR